MIRQSNTDENINLGWSELLAQKEQFIGGAVQRLKSTPPNSSEAKILRDGIKSQAEFWREYVRADADATGAAPTSGEPIPWLVAVEHLGVKNESDIERLMEWGLLSEVTQLVLMAEVERLKRDRTWWRDLVDIDPKG